MCKYSLDKIKVLHITNNTSPTNMGYNEFYLRQRELGVRTKNIALISGGKSSFYRFFCNILSIGKAIDMVHVHSHQLLFISYILLLLSKKHLSNKIIYTVHTSYENLKGKNRFLFYVNFLVAAKVVFCSQASLESFPKAISSRKKSIVIRNGVETELLNSEVKINKEGFISVGRLIDLKSPLAIAQEFVEDDTKAITFVGEGRLKRMMEERCVGNNIRYTGLIPRSEVLILLCASEFFISNSKVEGLPISLLESIMCGCIPILSDIPPHREVLDEGIYGILMEGNNVKRAINKAINISKKDLLSIREKNKKIIIDKFSLSNMNRLYIDVYKTMCLSTTK